MALDHYLGFVDGLLTAAGWGTLDTVVGGETRQLGTRGEHRARVSAQPFETLRALSGRRSVRQIRPLDWQGESDELVDFLQSALSGGYALPASDLVE